MNFFSSEVHDKGDPFRVGPSWAVLGEFGQVTSYQPEIVCNLTQSCMRFCAEIPKLCEILPKVVCVLAQSSDPSDMQSRMRFCATCCPKSYLAQACPRSDVSKAVAKATIILKLSVKH